MRRVFAYVDGFNLYYGLKSKGWKRYYWLDLPALCGQFLQSDQALGQVHFFTARIRDNGRNTNDMRRQSTYIDALSCGGVAIHEGHFLEKQRTCRQCGATWLDYEEKKTDVNVAAQLLGDAFDDKFDTAFVISGDSDLTTPIERVRARFPKKQVVVLLPPGRHSKELKRVATGYLGIPEAKLRTSQLADPVLAANGYAHHRPGTWK